MSSAATILNIAELRMRQRGYNAVSYREIAGEIGIKSASLHYHFPKKADLGEALVKRYAEQFETALNRNTEHLSAPSDKLAAFIDIYRAALTEDKLVCLCAVLGAEAPGLPDNVSLEIRKFFELNISWLENIYTQMKGPKPKAQAQATLSALEGAMIVASVNKDPEIFEAVASRILPNWFRANAG